MSETVSISTLDGAGRFDAYLARPDGKPRAAIVVIQEIFGVNAGIRRKCDRLAADGYLALAKQAADAADRFRAGITAIPGLTLLGKSDSTIVSYAAVGADVYALADRLEARGWTVDRQQRPASIHLTVTANHAAIASRITGTPRIGVKSFFCFLTSLCPARAATLTRLLSCRCSRSWSDAIEIWWVDMPCTRASSIGTSRSVEQTSRLPTWVSMPTAPPTTSTGPGCSCDGLR